MKNGGTRLAHKAEHTVDLGTTALLGVTAQDADARDPETMVETMLTTAEQLAAFLSDETLTASAALGIRSYVSQPDRARRD